MNSNQKAGSAAETLVNGSHEGIRLCIHVRLRTYPPFTRSYTLSRSER
jgi:hypothetical protein